MTTPFHHVPVLCQQVVDALIPCPGRQYVDATLGGGGHSQAILQQAKQLGDPPIQLLGLDQDEAALTHARQVLAPYPSQVTIVQANFSALPQVLSGLGWGPITGGVLADLGVSSHQLDEGSRGFSFRHEAPLDMRMDRTQPLTADTIVNTYTESELCQLFSQYGEARYSKTIAREIVRVRNTQPLHTTRALANLVEAITHRMPSGPSQPRKSKSAGREQGGRKTPIHPATQIFQALRIAVNDELGHLERFLAALPPLLAPGARIAIISFHSLEDRIVKHAFQEAARDCICPPRLPICQCDHRATLKILSSKPIVATDEEIEQNPRARSAKLRVAERI